MLTAARKAPEAAQNEGRILAEEAERVDSATVLAELIAPILANKLQALPVPTALAAPAAATARKPDGLTSPPRRARVPSPEISEPSHVPGIADMIDGMLSQERELTPGRQSV